jgi:hypothetical protein
MCSTTYRGIGCSDMRMPNLVTSSLASSSVSSICLPSCYAHLDLVEDFGDVVIRVASCFMWASEAMEVAVYVETIARWRRAKVVVLVTEEPRLSPLLERYMPAVVGVPLGGVDVEVGVAVGEWHAFAGSLRAAPGRNVAPT